MPVPDYYNRSAYESQPKFQCACDKGHEWTDDK
jgi:hypothetical protein